MDDQLEAVVRDKPAAETERRRSSRKKLTIEVSQDLHRRILTICSTRGLPVNEAVRQVLERAFPG